MDTRPLSTSAAYSINEGVTVKGEERIVDIVSRLFKPEEKIVEREIKRKLTKTPEEFAAQEQKNAQGSREKKPGPKTTAGWRYRIKKALLGEQLCRKYHGLYMCPGCFKRKKLRLYRVNKSNDLPKESDYLLLCDDCVAKKRAQGKKTKLWSRKPGSRGGSSQSTEIGFFNSIRALVFERDGKVCVWCGGEEKLGLGPLIPRSRGGKLCFDNYVITCQRCRGSKGSKLPLEYVWGEISLDYWLHEQLDHEPTATPGVTVRVNMHLVAEIQQYLHRQAAGEEVDRSKAERLAIKLSETNEDRARERRQLPW